MSPERRATSQRCSEHIAATSHPRRATSHIAQTTPRALLCYCYYYYYYYDDYYYYYYYYHYYLPT